jgi:phosphoenolpyruvate-protein kinase (PTS system EI component)
MNGVHLHGIPYAPGCSQGLLQRHVEAATSSDILLVHRQGLESIGQRKPAGLVVVDGAPFSHDMIQLTGLGIPVVIISNHQAGHLRQGICLRLDGATGLIAEVSPEQPLEYRPPQIPQYGQPVVSADGVKSYLRASISSIAGANNARAYGAAAIGLVRSEFFLPRDGTVPDTAFFIETFTNLFESVAPLPVTVRLLDLCPGKRPPWLEQLPGLQGPLGLQGARLYHTEAVRRVLFAQLEALDQLALRFDVQILIPYLTSLDEFRYWRNKIGSMFSRSVVIGAMAETPAVLLDIKNWLTEADFVAMGTNDLMQCLFAADRDLPELRHYLNPYTPGLFRLLQNTAQEAAEHVVKIQVCGLLAQCPGVLPILLGLGYRAFSVEATRIPFLAQVIRQTSINNAVSLAKQVISAHNSAAVCDVLNVSLPHIWSERFWSKQKD